MVTKKSKKPMRSEGWARPTSSLQWHYFVQCESVCGKFKHAGDVAKYTPTEKSQRNRGRSPVVKCSVCDQVVAGT